MGHRPLKNPLESEAGDRSVKLVQVSQFFDRLFQKDLQFFNQFGRIPAACSDHFCGCRIVKQGKEQVLHGHKFMAAASRLGHTEVHRYLQFFAQFHSASIVHLSGI